MNYLWNCLDSGSDSRYPSFTMKVIILRNTKYLSMNGTRSFPDSLEPVFWKRDVRGSERLTKFGGKEEEEKGEGLVLLVYFKLRRFEAWKWLHGPRISIRCKEFWFPRGKDEEQELFASQFSPSLSIRGCVCEIIESRLYIDKITVYW